VDVGIRRGGRAIEGRAMKTTGAFTGGAHPLEIIAPFRRWPRSRARDLLYTGIWNSMIALALTLSQHYLGERSASFWSVLHPNLVISNMIGYLIHFAVQSVSRLIRPTTVFARVLVVYVAVVGSCVVLGMTLAAALLQGINPLRYLASNATLVQLLPFALLTAVFMVAVFLSGERRVANQLERLRQSEQLANAAQLVAEARLRSLQAQIEPHFLYNTLANVVGLIETQPQQARHMLERFIDYLRGSLAASRADSATLGAELDLVAAYLDVLAVRMGPRLRHRFEIGRGCRDIVIAPMLLQPVVENAVAHGLEPKVEGGEIVIRAVREAQQLVLEVSDSGAGLSGAPTKPGGGVGLSNLRARLRTLYDGAAQVQLLENQPCGITLRIVLPLKEE
jgi:sensor histidine kinase YesM